MRNANLDKLIQNAIGTWDGGEYAEGDVVFHEGDFYVAQMPVPAGVTPDAVFTPPADFDPIGTKTVTLIKKLMTVAEAEAAINTGPKPPPWSYYKIANLPITTDAFAGITFFDDDVIIWSGYPFFNVVGPLVAGLYVQNGWIAVTTAARVAHNSYTPDPLVVAALRAQVTAGFVGAWKKLESGINIVSWTDGEYSAGDFVYVNDILYRAMQDIVVGDTEPGAAYTGPALPALGVTSTGGGPNISYVDLTHFVLVAGLPADLWKIRILSGNFVDTEGLMGPVGATVTDEKNIMWSGYPGVNAHLADDTFIVNGWVISRDIASHPGIDITQEFLDAVTGKKWERVVGADAVPGIIVSWVDGVYAAGALVFANGCVYEATAAIAVGDEAPDTSTTSPWQRLSGLRSTEGVLADMPANPAQGDRHYFSGATEHYPRWVVRNATEWAEDVVAIQVKEEAREISGDFTSIALQTGTTDEPKGIIWIRSDQTGNDDWHQIDKLWGTAWGNVGGGPVSASNMSDNGSLHGRTHFEAVKGRRYKINVCIPVATGPKGDKTRWYARLNVNDGWIDHGIDGGFWEEGHGEATSTCFGHCSMQPIYDSVVNMASMDAYLYFSSTCSDTELLRGYVSIEDIGPTP